MFFFNFTDEKDGPDELDELNKLETDELKIDYRFYETSIREIHSWKEDGDINFNPEYQRGFVWSKKMSSKFIESILWGLPIPGIILVKYDNDKFEVLDGKQRLTTIFNYINEEPFNLEKSTFKLSKEIEKFGGLKFSDLDENDRKKILRTKIFVTQIDTNKSSKKAIYSTFERVNTGGLKLHPQNIRMAIYNSKLMKGITHTMTSIVNEKNKRFSKKDIAQGVDIELVLRVLATYYMKNNEGVKKINSTKKIIDDFSEFVFFHEINSQKYISQNNIFREMNFPQNMKDTLKTLFGYIKDLKEQIIYGVHSKGFGNLLWEAFFVFLLDYEMGDNDINSVFNLLTKYNFSRSEDSNWYNHTNNWLKVLGRIQEIDDYIKNTKR